MLPMSRGQSLDSDAPNCLLIEQRHAVAPLTKGLQNSGKHNHSIMPKPHFVNLKKYVDLVRHGYQKLK